MQKPPPLESGLGRWWSTAIAPLQKSVCTYYYILSNVRIRQQFYLTEIVYCI